VRILVEAWVSKRKLKSTLGDARSKGPAQAKRWPGELGEPLKIPFQDIRPAYLEDPEGFAKKLNELCFLESVKKLVAVADHYGIKDQDPAQWAFGLALCLARDLHPGFRVVYSGWQAEAFKVAHDGFTPFFTTVEGDGRPKGTGWAPLLMPEIVALLVDTFKPVTKLTDEKIVEILAVSFEPQLAKPSKKLEKQKKVATLLKRLSVGRRRRNKA
jgi:hypothetical protein